MSNLGFTKVGLLLLNSTDFCESFLELETGKIIYSDDVIREIGDFYLEDSKSNIDFSNLAKSLGVLHAESNGEIIGLIPAESGLWLIKSSEVAVKVKPSNINFVITTKKIDLDIEYDDQDIELPY